MHLIHITEVTRMQTQQIIQQFSQLMYRKLPSGHYEAVGELPKGTRKVRIDIDGHFGSAIFSGKRALRVISEAIATNHACADVYEIVPLIVDDPILTALQTSNLAKARDARKQKRA